MICLPVGPRCDHCLLGKAKICPSRITNIKAEGRKEVVYTFTDGDEEDVKVEGPRGAKLEVGYEDLQGQESESPLREIKAGEEMGVKQELDAPGLTEEAVLEILDQVDGSKEIGA